MVLVDSCVWIEAGKQQGDLKIKVALESLLDEYEAAFCGPVKLEVLGAVRKEKRKAMTFFFDVIPYLPMEDRLWESAKKLSWQLRDAGLTVPWNDILIATLCLEHGCRVYSIDHHFVEMSRICGLPLYRPGYGGGYDPGVE